MPSIEPRLLRIVSEIQILQADKILWTMLDPVTVYNLNYAYTELTEAIGMRRIPEEYELPYYDLTCLQKLHSDRFEFEELKLEKHDSYHTPVWLEHFNRTE